MATARSARGARRLDAGTVVQAALQLAHEHGIEAVSMRVLADRLDVTPMAIYHYVKTKDLLIKLVADAVVATVELPDPDRDWRVELSRTMRDYRQTVAGYPGLAAILLRGGVLPHARRLLSRQLEILEEAGFAPEDARRAYAAYHLLVLGRLTVDEARRTRWERGPARARDSTIEAYLAELQGETAFEIATTVLLDGLQNTMVVPKQRRNPARTASGRARKPR